MRMDNPNTDKDHFSAKAAEDLLKPFLNAMRLEPMITNKTTDTELAGISMAAIIGLRFPLMAKYRPVILYKREMTRLALTRLWHSLQKSMNRSSWFKWSESNIASQAGEKLYT
jgi:hypothetical protein